MENLRSSSAMPYFATILITLLLALPAMSAELFRYRGAAMDGGTLEYIFTASVKSNSSGFSSYVSLLKFLSTFFGNVTIFQDAILTEIPHRNVECVPHRQLRIKNDWRSILWAVQICSNRPCG
jgi:hypothetical protein